MPRKIAGLPILVWGGVLVAALALGLYLRRRSPQPGAALVAPYPGTGGGPPPGEPAAGTLSPELVGGLFSDFVAGLVAAQGQALDFAALSQLALVEQSGILARLTETSVERALGLAETVVSTWERSVSQPVITVSVGPLQIPTLPSGGPSAGGSRTLASGRLFRPGGGAERRVAAIPLGRAPTTSTAQLAGLRPTGYTGESRPVTGAFRPS